MMTLEQTYLKAKYLIDTGKISQDIFRDLMDTEIVAVVHAHWTRKRTLSHDGELYCSNCEWTPEALGCITLGDLQVADIYHCPHCGAKMD